MTWERPRNPWFTADPKEYRRYLASAKWQARREEYLASGHAHCEGCGITEATSLAVFGVGLAVHHLSYERLGAEQDEDLETQCCQCHGSLETPPRAATVPVLGAGLRPIKRRDGSQNWFCPTCDGTLINVPVKDPTLVAPHFRCSGCGAIWYGDAEGLFRCKFPEQDLA